jgi:murein DD-endopeptidase MepM/ murein hydrolase activator NlpD
LGFPKWVGLLQNGKILFELLKSFIFQFCKKRVFMLLNLELKPLRIAAIGLFVLASIGVVSSSLPLFSQSVQAESEEIALRKKDYPNVKQGEVFHLILKTSDSSPIPVRASLAGRTVHFYPAGEADTSKPNTYEALLPISVFQKPGLYPLTVEEQPSGQSKVLYSVRIEDAHYRIQNVTVSKSTEGLQPLPGELEAVQSLKDAQTPLRFWKEPFLSPTPDCQNSPFGVKRYHNGVPTGDYHKGVDLRSPMGRPIKATAAGTVKIATMYRLHGGTVGLDHGQGISSIYIHMSRLNAHAGQHVERGDTIGYVGSTGFATGPHLHWGLFVNGLPVNPNPWLQGKVPTCN